MSEQQLLLLLVGLPPTPSSLRVRVWRRLRSLGAVALKRSAYLLPDTPERYEDFQWLAQEVEREGGEATLIRVQQIENMSSGDVLRLFHEPRDRDYRQVATRYRRVLQGLDRKSVSPQTHEKLVRLSKDYQRIRDIDFFDAPGGAEVRRLEEAIAMRTRSPETPQPEPKPSLDLSKLRGRRWVFQGPVGGGTGRLGKVSDVIRVDDPADARLADYARLTDSSLRTSLEA